MLFCLDPWTVHLLVPTAAAAAAAAAVSHDILAAFVTVFRSCFACPCFAALLLQVTQLTKGFTLMQAQLKLAKGGVPKLEGDKFADVVEPFLDKAQVRVWVRVCMA